ncbi:Spy/CpxP family protein refolding chaperone [Methylobacterium variabile]|uniref:Spy/CpxP family protein refolding chaperone n=1 Tax=Methylobacterium variabile TaxID=298794 RepID=UPI000A4321B7|nr:Spy/CpxP family protein refolding chaperone [Methylobacterium variabile]
MTTIFFGTLSPSPGGATPVAPVCCSAVVVCHVPPSRHALGPRDETVTSRRDPRHPAARTLTTGATAGIVAGILGAGLLGAALAGTAALAQAPDGPRAMQLAHAGGPDGRRGLSAEDVQAFTDARVAALHAGLKLTPDQEKLWPPVEDAIRNLAKLNRNQREARRGRDRDPLAETAPDAIRARADALGARADALRKLADASQPLYATLDQAQKQRAAMLSRPMGPHRGMHRHHRDD